MPRVGSIIKNTRGCAEPALIDGNALGKPRTDPSELQPVQDAKARMRVKATGQEVFEHAALMEYALGSAILGQEQDIALHATRRRAEPQGLAVDADTAARTGDEARERAGHHIGARADLPGMQRIVPPGATSARSRTRPSPLSVSTTSAWPASGPAAEAG